MTTIQRVLPAALGIGALGALIARLADPFGSLVPPGTVILGVAAVGTVWTRARGSSLFGAAAAAFVLGWLVRSGNLFDVTGGDGVGVALGRGLQIGGAGIALVAGLALGLRRPWARTARDPFTARSWGQAAPIVALLVLCPIGAELLAAYDDSTGRPAELLFAVVFFAGLYGCPALLIREAVRRAERGWPSIVLLAAAAGLLQAGVVDQSLFSDDYGDVTGWEASLRATYVAPLGIGASMALNFLVGHVVFSFCAPIALAEAMHPATATAAWLGWRGQGIAAAGWLATAAMILDGVRTSASHGSATEVGVTLVVVAALTVAAFRVRPTPGARPGDVPRVRTVLGASLGLGLVYGLVATETWLGVGLGLAVVGLSAGMLVRTSGRARWSLAHTAAVATGALLARGALAFLYFPVVGEVSPERKYAHNVAMLLIVAAAGAWAIRQASRAVTDGTGPPGPAPGSPAARTRPA